MRHAYGKPNGLVARVRTGQPIISIRYKDEKKQVVIEVLRRAKMKISGRQKMLFPSILLILISFVGGQLLTGIVGITVLQYKCDRFF